MLELTKGVSFVLSSVVDILYRWIPLPEALKYLLGIDDSEDEDNEAVFPEHQDQTSASSATVQAQLLVDYEWIPLKKHKTDFLKTDLLVENFSLTALSSLPNASSPPSPVEKSDPDSESPTATNQCPQDTSNVPTVLSFSEIKERAKRLEDIQNTFTFKTIPTSEAPLKSTLSKGQGLPSTDFNFQFHPSPAEKLLQFKRVTSADSPMKNTLFGTPGLAQVDNSPLRTSFNSTFQTSLNNVFERPVCEIKSLSFEKKTEKLMVPNLPSHSQQSRTTCDMSLTTASKEHNQHIQRTVFPEKLPEARRLANPNSVSNTLSMPLDVPSSIANRTREETAAFFQSLLDRPSPDIRKPFRADPSFDFGEVGDAPKKFSMTPQTLPVAQEAHLRKLEKEIQRLTQINESVKTMIKESKEITQQQPAIVPNDPEKIVLLNVPPAKPVTENTSECNTQATPTQKVIGQRRKGRKSKKGHCENDGAHSNITCSSHVSQDHKDICPSQGHELWGAGSRLNDDWICPYCEYKRYYGKTFPLLKSSNRKSTQSTTKDAQPVCK
jgi:hypothetical protein